MSKRTFLLVGILVIQAIFIPMMLGKEDTEQSNEQIKQGQEVIEESFISRGTEYRLRVNTSNHTVSILARHFADNETNAGYAATLNDKQILGTRWDATPGATSKRSTNLMNQYYAGTILRNITFSTYGSQDSVTYNFTVPRKHEGQYLRPTITDLGFERVNSTHGKVSVTLRSDSKWYYPVYYQIWTPSVSAEYIPVQRQKGENVTTGSIIIPVEEGSPLEGEIRAHGGYLNKSGPLYTQLEFYGQPGNVQFERVPYEPIELNRVREYEYRNESTTNETGSVIPDAQYREVLGVLAFGLLGVIVLALLIANLRRRG